MLRPSIPVFCLLLLSAVPGSAGEPAAASVSAKNPGSAKDPVLTETGAEPAARRDHFRVSAGWMWRQVGDARFITGSRPGSLTLPSLFGSSRLSDPGIGPAGAYGSRRYADGYVGIDGGTAGDGATSLWGYENAGQVENDTLRYHAAGTRSEVRRGENQQPGAEWAGDEEGNAPVVQLDWWREIKPGFSVGAQLQWSFLQLDGQDRSRDFTAWQQRDDFSRSFTDSYRLQGITVPAAPYAGAGLGFGPLLDNIPAGRDFRETPAGGERAEYFNDVRQSLDINVNTLSLGPTLGFTPGRLPVQLQVSGGLSLNIADWEADQRETLFLSKNGGPAKAVKEWHSHAGGTEVLPGFYLHGGAAVQLTPRISLSGFGRYEWSEELDERVGPSAIHLDLSGWSAGVVLGCAF